MGSTCLKEVKETEESVDGSELEAVIARDVRLALCLQFVRAPRATFHSVFLATMLTVLRGGRRLGAG